MTNEKSPWEDAGIRNAADMEQAETGASNVASVLKQFFNELRTKPNPLTRAEALQLTSVWLSTVLTNQAKK